MSDGSHPGGREAALSAVSGPAVGLIATAAIGAVIGLLNLTRFGLTALLLDFYEKNKVLPAEQLAAMRDSMTGLTPINLLSTAFAFAMSVLVVVGALKLKRLESRGLAMTSAIVALVPCLSPFCCVGLPVGIWALMAMNKPDVRAAFGQDATA